MERMMNAYNSLFTTLNQQLPLHNYVAQALPEVVELTNFDETGLLTSLPRIMLAIGGTTYRNDVTRCDRIITSAGELPCVRRFENGDLQPNVTDLEGFESTLELAHWILVSKSLSSGKAIAYLYVKHSNGDWYLVITAHHKGVKSVPGIVSQLCHRFDATSNDVYKAIAKAMLLNLVDYSRTRRGNHFIR